MGSVTGTRSGGLYPVATLSIEGGRMFEKGRQVRYAVCTENGAATLACDALIPGALQDQ